MGASTGLIVRKDSESTVDWRLQDGASSNEASALAAAEAGVAGLSLADDDKHQSSNGRAEPQPAEPAASEPAAAEGPGAAAAAAADEPCSAGVPSAAAGPPPSQDALIEV